MIQTHLVRQRGVFSRSSWLMRRQTSSGGIPQRGIAF